MTRNNNETNIIPSFSAEINSSAYPTDSMCGRLSPEDKGELTYVSSAVFVSAVSSLTAQQHKLSRTNPHILTAMQMPWRKNNKCKYLLYTDTGYQTRLR